jgi:hypothetical protein
MRVAHHHPGSWDGRWGPEQPFQDNITDRKCYVLFHKDSSGMAGRKGGNIARLAGPPSVANTSAVMGWKVRMTFRGRALGIGDQAGHHGLLMNRALFIRPGEGNS